jgi:cyclophilin family peptidyl-prolyl cis-trans isomerase
MVGGLIIGAVATNQPVDTGDVQVITQTVTPSQTPITTGTPSGTGTPGGSVTPGGTVTGTPGPQQYDALPAMAIDTAKTYFATIRTAKGDIRIQLDAAKAPQTVNSFVFLAREGFYDGTTFHRVIPGFVAQGGDPTGTGAGGPGYTVPDETNDLTHEPGVIAMAKNSDPQSGLPVPNSAGSQFYLTYVATPWLNGSYTVFGRVVAGQDVLQQLTPRDPSQGGNLPAGDVIQTIAIEEQ